MRYQTELLNPTFTHPSNGKTMPNTSGWQDRHVEALRNPTGFEAAIVLMLKGWTAYADAHRFRYSSRVEGDYVMGPEWEAIGRSVIGLLNGDTGRLDCGTLDGFIRNTLQSEGFNHDD